MNIEPESVQAGPAASFSLFCRVLQPAGTRLATVLTAHGAPEATVNRVLGQMDGHRVAMTANRSVVGRVMNEFACWLDPRPEE